MKVLTLIMALLLPMTIWGASMVGKVDIQRVLITIKEGKAVRDKLKSQFDEKQKGVSFHKCKEHISKKIFRDCMFYVSHSRLARWPSARRWFKI